MDIERMLLSRLPEGHGLTQQDCDNISLAIRTALEQKHIKRDPAVRRTDFDIEQGALRAQQHLAEDCATFLLGLNGITPDNIRAGRQRLGRAHLGSFTADQLERELCESIERELANHGIHLGRSPAP